MARLTWLRPHGKAVRWGLAAGPALAALAVLGVSISSAHARLAPAAESGQYTGAPRAPAQFDSSEDSFICLGALATIAGTHGDDIITGTDGQDVITGRGGNDTIDGRGSDDLICGGSGDDFILGSEGF